MVFILVLFAIVPLLLLTQVGLVRSLGHLQASRQDVDVQASLHAAEAAADWAIQNLRATNNAWTPPSSGWKPLLGGVEYRIRVAEFNNPPLADPDQREFIARGRRGGVEQQLKVVTEFVSPATLPGTPTMFGTSLVDVNSPTLFDAYDSSLGPYNPATRVDDVVMRTNGIVSGDIKIQDPVTIYGDIMVGYGGNPPVVIEEVGGGAVTRPTSMGSDIAAPANLALPLVPQPDMSCADQSTTLTSSYTFDSTVQSVYRLCGIDLGTSDILTTTGGGEITVHVNGKFKLGSTTSSITGDTQVRFIINGDFEIYSQGALAITAGTQEDPKKLRFDLYYSGSGTPPRTQLNSGALSVYGHIYAPGRNIQLLGSSGTIQVFGALNGNSIVISSGNNALHSDVALANQLGSGGGSPSVTVRLWKHAD